MGNGTSIGRVRGLGAAGEGTHHWLLQRFTAIGNLVTVPYLGLSLALLPDRSHGALSAWVAQPVSAVALVLLVISTFWHARLGLQVVIEDYVHDAGAKFGALAALNLGVFGGGVFALLCIARLALGGNA